MAHLISANDLKTKGIATIEEATSSGNEAIITVRGQQRYVVLSVEHYNYLRECELESAVAESRRDVEEGRTVSETVEDHIARITGG